MELSVSPPRPKISKKPSDGVDPPSTGSKPRSGLGTHTERGEARGLAS